MKKKKLIIPIAALAVTCGLSAGVLTGCNKDAHTHSYTQWEYNTTEHWKECPDDGAVDETTRENHVFIAGECECGATDTPAAEKKYGNATGQVKLRKLGQDVTDYAGVSIDIGSDDVDIDFDETTGEFTMSNLEVGKTYNLTISKNGYEDYVLSTVRVEEEGETVTIGGSRGCVLSYKAFEGAVNWHSPVYDRVNEDVPTIGTTSNTMADKTVDRYDDVAVTLTLDRKCTTNAEGLWIFFEDGNFVSVAIGNKTTKIEWDGVDYNSWGLSGNMTMQATGNRWTMQDGDGKSIYYDSTPKEIADKHAAGTLNVTLVRQGVRIYAFVDGVFADVVSVDEKYADDGVQVGFWAKDAVSQTDGSYARWKFAIESDISKYLQDVNVTIEEMENGSASLAQPSYKIGDRVTINFTPDSEDYELTSVTVDGTDVTSAVMNSQYTFRADKADYTVEAMFAETTTEKATITANVSAIGPDGDVTVEGENVIFSSAARNYSYTVSADNTITGEIRYGTYTATLGEGYFPITVTVDENGLSSSSLAFEKQLFKSGDTKPVAIHSSYTGTTEGLTVILKKELSQSDLKQQGFVYRFDNDNKWIYIRIEYHGSSGYLQYAWSDAVNNATGFAGGVLDNFWTKVGNKDLDSAAIQAFVEDGLKLTFLRAGNMIYIFGNEQLLETKTLDSKYTDSDGTAYVIVESSTGENIGFEWLDGDAVNNMLNATYTAKADNTVNGSITFSKSTGIEMNEEITITATPDQGYLCTSITVNGVDYLLNSSDPVIKVGVTADITVSATFVQSIVTEIDVNKDNKNNIYLNAKIDGMNVIDYVMYIRDGDNLVSLGDNTYDYIDLSELKHGGIAWDFDQHGWTVKSGDWNNGVAPCITGEFNIKLKLTKNVQQIRLFVGGWWMDNHGGAFTLVDSAGNVLAKYVYRSSSGSDPNDIIIFNIDTTDWTDGAIKEYNLHFNNAGYNEFPFAGIQLLGTGAGIEDAMISVSAGIAGDAHGYKVALDRNGVSENGQVVVTIETSNANDAWAWFPTAIKVNGTEIDFSTVIRESLGANRCKFTYTLTGITEDTEILVTIGQIERVSYSATVDGETGGTIKCDMENWGKEYYWNDLCTFTITADEGYELKKLVINDQEVTDWTQDGNVYTYKYVVVGDINAVVYFEQTVTVSGTATIVTDPTTEVVFGSDITEDGTTYEVLAYERFGQDSANTSSAKNVSSDSSVLNGVGWITNNGGASGSFGGKGYTVTGVNGIVDGSCVYIQTGDANIKITKDVAQIRIYVGAWNDTHQQGGTFTLKAGDKTIATCTYANNGEGTPNGDKKNDVIVFTIDTSALGEDDVVNAVLHFENGYTESTQPCAGIQVLGVKQATEAE